MPFFLSRFWPTVVLIFMTTVYVSGVRYDMSPPNALTAASGVGIAALVLVIGIMSETGGRNRMDNPIALWTTFYMALAPVAFAVYAQQSPYRFLSVIVAIAFFVTAVASAYLLERFIMGGQRGWWFIEYGFAPLALGWASAGEVGGHHVMAGVTLGFYWFLHFFYKQLPQIAESLGVKPYISSG